MKTKDTSALLLDAWTELRVEYNAQAHRVANAAVCWRRSEISVSEFVEYVNEFVEVTRARDAAESAYRRSYAVKEATP